MTKPLTKGDMVRYLHWVKDQAVNKSADWESLLSCPLMSGTNESSCYTKGCQTPGYVGNGCGVFFAKYTGGWVKTGIPLMSDRTIKTHIRTVLKDWQSINKMRARLSLPNLSSQQQKLVENFQHKMSETFLITDSNAEELIRNDRLRNDEQKNEDIEFLKSMKEDRIASVAKIDNQYQQKVDNKVRRQEVEQRKLVEEQRRQESSRNKDTLRTEVVDDSGSDEDFLEKENKRNKKDDSVTIEVPKNIVEILAPTANRYDVSSTALSSLLLQTVAVGGGSIDTLPLSRRQVERTSKKSLHSYADNVKEAFKEIAKDKFFVCHFDGKQLEEFSGGIKATKERLSVLVSSPDLDHAQVLGAVALDGQTGNEIFVGVIQLLEDFGLTDRIIGMSFDTTASNTGVRQGACARLENDLTRALLWLACRRHVMELHIKHVAKVIGEKISGRKHQGPEHLLFKRLKDEWPNLLPQIDLADLRKFNWQAVHGTEMEDHAQRSLEDLSRFLAQKTFDREDYKELCELSLLYLGGAVPSFKFQYPGAHHHARYMASCLYILKMTLLLDKLTWLKEVEREEVRIMAEFISVFYVIWWLKAYVGVKAPMNDLIAIKQMKMYSKYKQLTATTCLASWGRHTWYLTEELVVLSLADTTCPFRDDIAAAIVKQEILEVFHPRKPKLPQIPDRIWPSDGSLPNLALFVGPRSYLIFYLLKFSSAEMDWLKFGSEEWDKFSGYQKFAQFVTKLAVVNDAGERGVKGIQEVVGKTTLESLRQDMLVTNAEERKLHANRGKGESTKAKLAKVSTN